MRLLLSAALLLWLAPAQAAECYITLGVGYDRHIDEGRNPQSVIRPWCVLARDVYAKGDSVSVEYDHHSSVFNGAPFNNKPEDLTDQWSLTYTWRIK